MKRSALLRKLRMIARDAGSELEFVRHGSNHDQYRIASTLLPIPRHREIKEGTARAIVNDATAATRGQER